MLIDTTTRRATSGGNKDQDPQVSQEHQDSQSEEDVAIRPNSTVWKQEVVAQN